jgi:chemotaxis protein CheD
VGVGALAVGAGSDLLVAYGLGSCVAILLHDPVAGVVGMRAHASFPAAKYVSAGVTELLAEMVMAGGSPSSLGARLAGGASMFAGLSDPGDVSIGEKNVAAAREALRGAGVTLLAEDVGGAHGRTVRLHASDGRAVVSSVSREEIVL